YRAARRLLAAHDGGGAGSLGVDLIFAASDVMAMGAMTALREAGLRPGEEIGVAGFDDVPTIRDVTPALTTVRVPLEEMGAAAVRLALGDDDAPATARIHGD